MDNVQKTAITDYNAPLSEPFRLHLYNQLRFLSFLFYLKTEEDPASET
jgi:hypothetical protein